MFSFEKGPSLENQENQPKLHIDNQYDNFLSEDFRNNPEQYIEEQGKNIKSGKLKYHENGSIREDPTASKFLPEWQNTQGEIIQPVSKKVNLKKVKTRTEAGGEKFEDPLLEYKMMSLCQILDLPSAKPIGFVKQGENLYTLMERVRGFTWTERDKEILGRQGLTAEDQEPIQKQIEELMDESKKKYEEFGIYRKWKHKDMVFDLDTESKRVTKITPVDWERSYLNVEKLTQRISHFSPKIRAKIWEIITLKT